MNRDTKPAHRPRSRTRAPAVMLVSLLLAIGCKSGTIGEAGGVDAQGPVPDATVAFVPDATVAPVPDARVAPVPDAAVSYDAPAPPPDAPPPRSCDELYGASVEYILCIETPTTCLFNVRTDGGNCNDLCAQFGGECLNAFDNNGDPGAECLAIVASGDDCTTNRNTEICECKRL